MTVGGAIGLVMLSGVLAVIGIMVAERWRDIGAALAAGRPVRPLAASDQLQLPLRYAA